MLALTKTWHRLRTLLGRRRMEQELDEELQYHIERQVELNIEQGMAPGEARAAALRSFGGVESPLDQFGRRLQPLRGNMMHAVKGKELDFESGIRQ